MGVTKRSGDYSDSNSDDSLKRNRDDDMEAMFTRRKQRKTTATTTLVPSSSSKMIWTKNDELLILAGIVDYENETKLSYRFDWDAFYRYVKDSVEAKFSKKQLINKVKSLKRKFTYNQTISGDGKELSFTSTDDDEIFKLSRIIWAKTETECVSNDNVDQAKDVPCTEQENMDVPCAEQENKDVPCAEQESKGVPCAEQESKEVPCAEQENKGMSCAEQEINDVPCAEQESKEVPCAEQENKGMSCAEQEIKDVPCAEQESKDVPCAQQERVSIEIDNCEKEKSKEDGVEELNVQEETPKSGISFQNLGKNGEKEKSKEDGVNELGVLQEVLEAEKFFQNLGRYQQKLMLQNLQNIEAEKRKTLVNEWKALFLEELQFNIKKQTFSAKLANEGCSP